MLKEKKSNKRETEMDSAEKMAFLQEEYADYLRKTKTTAYERKLLRAWVSQGHSVYESGGSRYLCDPYPPLDYLETYRIDKKIKQELKGKNPAEQEAYLREYMGYDDEEAKKEPPENPVERIRRLEREVFYLWEYLISAGLHDQAEKYVKEHKGEAIPFEYEG